jgi:hypothetical protein
MCASARAYLTYSTSLPHIIPVDIYTGTRKYDDDWSPLRSILQPSIIYLGFLFSLALYPHSINKFVLIVSYLYVAMVLSQHWRPEIESGGVP